ncbi:MAG: hypothetical protein HYS27_14085 [Deltaproteobacteria bacterium]|nr:hypothetical protein [Deltaproteobacteria bacterium]
MIALLDAWGLALVPFLLVSGALFVLVMPSPDRLALRHVGLAVSITAGLVGLRVASLAVAAPLELQLLGATLRLDALNAPMLVIACIAVPIALRAGAPRVFERTQFYVVTVLFCGGLGAAALLVAAPVVKLVIATLAAVPLFALVSLFGGPQRGSSTMKAAVLWLLVDAGAMAAAVLLAARAHVPVATATVDDLAVGASAQPQEQSALLFLALAAPGLVRLAAGPFSVWLSDFLEQAPVSAAVIASATAAPLGLELLARVALPAAPAGALALLPAFLFVGLLALAVSAILALAERELRRLTAQLLHLAGAAAALAVVSFGGGAIAAAVGLVVAAAASAMLTLCTVESIERRYETRDCVELIGLGHQTPLLAALLAAGLFGLGGIPLIGAGTALWLLAGEVGSGPAFAAAALPPSWLLMLQVAIVAAAALGSIGVATAMRRLLLPAVRRTRRDLESVTAGQAVRLLVPAAVALLAGPMAAVIVHNARPVADQLARTAAMRAAVRTPAAAEPFGDVEDQP